MGLVHPDWHEFFSPGLLSMCGYDSGDLDNLSEEFDSRTHPDDMEILQKAQRPF